MNKTGIVVLSALVIIVLAGAAFITIINPLRKEDNTEQIKIIDASSNPGTENEEYLKQTKATAQQTESESTAKEKDDLVIKNEAVDVLNNSPEFDMKVLLSKLSSGKTVLRLEYYLDGISSAKEYSQEDIPELAGLFEKREGKSGSMEFKVMPASLNTKKSKVYFAITGKAYGEETETSFYVVNLKDKAIKRLFQEKGRFSEFKLSKNQEYVAFSFYDSASSSMYQENSLLQIVSCENDLFLISGSRNTKGERIGNNEDSSLIWDYEMLGWSSGNVLKLKETAAPKSGGGEKKSSEVLYDVAKNVFLNPDGSIRNLKDMGAPQGNKTQKESEAVKVLRNFYLLLAADKYKDAYDLLDDEFQLNAFKVFGLTKLSKSDIDVESFAMYGSIFKAARLESILEEKTDGSLASIYFYQAYALKDADDARQPLVAALRKTDKGWKLVALDDGNLNEKPFKQ
ncbi:MAG: hypothetical protein N2489_00840 [Clostridia bacterium]|nr:hypothetical protein [Clostridia bacterium]